MSPQVKTCVVDVKTPIKTGSRTIQRIKNERGDEGRGVISTMAENIGKVGKLCAQRHPEIIHVVKLRIGAGKDGGVRCCGQGDMRVSVREDNPLPGKLVEIGRQIALGAEETHSVGAS